jgi:hypothetical protein
MKSTSVLTAALAFSLLVNLVLWARIEREARISTSAAGTAPSTPMRGSNVARGTAKANQSSSEANATGRRGVVWREPRKPEELRALADELRAAGFPERHVRDLIGALIQRQVRGASDFAQMPFWHQTGGGKVARGAIEKMNEEAQAAERTVLGQRELDPAELDPIGRSARYGMLSDDKIALLAKIERDYGEVYWQQRRGAGNEDALDTFEGRNRIRVIEEEKERDLAAVLTPEEFEDYSRRRSRAALTVIQGVADITVSEEEYMALYQLQRRGFETLPRTPGVEEVVVYAHHAASPSEQVRTVLKDDRFYSYMENTDPVYGAVAKFARSTPALTRDQTYQLYQLQSAAILAIARTAGPGQQSDLANTPAARAALAPFNAQLDALLGPAAAAAYRRSSTGRMFAAPSGP